ncbi:unnamed protein product, partial [Rotaria sp. Silwood2]
MVPSDKRW